MSDGARVKREVLGLNGAEWAAITIALAAATLPTVLPLMVGVLARQFAIGNAQAGYVIALNMGAVLAGSLSCVLLARRFRWAPLIFAGLGVMVLGNALTMLTSSLTPLIATRLVSGWGEGIVGASCYALMGQARLPGRSIAFYMAGQSIIGATGLAVLPTLMAEFGWHIFYILVSIIAVPAMLLTTIATRGRTVVTTDGQASKPKRLSIGSFGALTAIFLFFVGIAMIWAFMEPLGVRQNISLTRLSIALSASSIAGLLGSFVSGALADRLRAENGLAIGAAVILGSLALLLTGGFYPYLVAICGLYFAWTYQFPFLFGCLAEMDSDGRIAALTPVATGGALTAAPAIGGYVLENGGLTMLSAGCFAFTSAATLIAAWVHKRPKPLLTEV